MKKKRLELFKFQRLIYKRNLLTQKPQTQLKVLKQAGKRNVSGMKYVNTLTPERVAQEVYTVSVLGREEGYIEI